jgi:hypothetical protein
MVGHGVATSADWVTSCTVGAEDWGVAVQTGEVVRATRVLLLAGTIEHVVWLVGSVQDITPEKSSSN